MLKIESSGYLFAMDIMVTVVLSVATTVVTIITESELSNLRLIHAQTYVTLLSLFQWPPCTPLRICMCCNEYRNYLKLQLLIVHHSAFALVI